MSTDRTAIVLIAAVLLVSLAFGVAASRGRFDPSRPAIVFTGGHETDPQDGGRPIVLIAAALGVPSEVFRDAFSGVRPARDGRPTREEAERNKEVLMKALGPHGVGPERLDEVSNFYRYRPQTGELWRHRPAQAYAELNDGKVERIVVTDPGYGYSTPPHARIQGRDNVPLTVTIEFGTDLEKNGSVRAIDVK